VRALAAVGDPRRDASGLGSGARTLSEKELTLKDFFGTLTSKGVERAVVTSRILAVVTAVALLTTADALAAPVSPSSSAFGSAVAKKRCHFVKKKVHGKVKRVRVCTKVKPKPKPKPVDVSVSLDANRASSFTLTPSGGTAALTTANGAKLTLSVPGGATATNVTVRVTPISSIRGFPLRKVVAGVQLEPEGLQLSRPAKLTINASSIPQGRLIGFSYAGHGRQLHPYPLAREGSGLSATITHFSGYGAAIVTDAARVAILGTMVAEWASIVTDLRVAAVDPSHLANTGVLNRYWAWKAVAKAYAWIPELTSYVAQLTTLAQQTVRDAVSRAREACQGRGRHAPLHELAPVFDVLRAVELAAALGLGELLQPPPEFELAGCLHFELDLDYRVTSELNTSSASEDHTLSSELAVKATKVPIALFPGRRRSTGEGALEVKTWSYSETIVEHQGNDPPVTCTSKSVSAAPSRNVRWSLEIEPLIQTGGHPYVMLTVDPGSVGITRNWKCTSTSETSLSTATSDVPPFFPGDAGIAGSTSYRVPLFEPPFGQFVGGDVYATFGPQTISGTVPGGLTYAMTRSFVLRHTPDR